jgi:hypothetical protein
MHLLLTDVLNLMGLLYGPLPADVWAAKKTSYSVFEMRNMNSCCLSLLLEKTSVAPGRWRRKVYVVMTPFCWSAGGGSQVTEKEMVEVLTAVMLVGGALGAVKRYTTIGSILLASAQREPSV